MNRYDHYGNKLSGRGVIRTDSGEILDVGASEYMTEAKLLRVYFPSKVFIATQEMDAAETPIEKGDEYAIVDDENWRLCDLITTPRPYKSLGITVFQPKDEECVIRN